MGSLDWSNLLFLATNKMVNGYVEYSPCEPCPACTEI